jgi:hypothetical protein
MKDFFHWLFIAYGIVFALIFAPLALTWVTDKAIIPFILWLHRMGVLRAQ